MQAADGAPGWEGQAWTRTVRVPVTTLDALIARHGMPAFIKIDVEGFEAEALAGLTRPSPALSFEFTTIQRDVAATCIERCAALGFARYNADARREPCPGPSGLGGCAGDRGLAARPAAPGQFRRHLCGTAMTRDFLGHPRGLAVLFATETWERFSYFGNAALVVLYMVKYLLDPGRIETVLGFGAVRTALEFLFGKLDPQPLASQLFGFYTGLAYFTPILGGLIADRLLGQRRTVIIGGVLMAIGHFMMAFEALFLFALAGADPRHRRIQAQHLGSGRRPLCAGRSLGATAPTRSSTSASISGRLLAPLVCGTLAVHFGWHYGFGAAGVGMLVSLGHLSLWHAGTCRPTNCHGPSGPSARRSRSIATSAAPCSR